MIVLYHGSDHKFDEFSFKKIGKESGTIGAGFGMYFSDDKSDALMYGKYVYTCNYDLKDNLSNESVTITPAKLHSIINKINDDFGKSYFDLHKDLTEEIAINQLIADSKSDTVIVGKLIEVLFDGKSDDVENILSIFNEYGFNHTIDKNTPDLKSITHYTLYDLKSIEINKMQTLDDI